MPSGSHLPTTLLRLLTPLRPVFTAPSFVTFTAMVSGFMARVGDHTVCGMLTGAGLAERWHHSRAHRFFSQRRWSLERLSLQLGVLIVRLLVPTDAPLELVVDDTLFRRRGPQVFGVRWCYDSAAPGPIHMARGTCFVVLGIVVSLPFCQRPVCLPVLCSLWEGGSKLRIARRLVLLMADRFPDRTLHVAADGAFAGRDLRGLPPRITWTTRLRKDAALYECAPPHTGRRGRPRTKGDKLASLTGLTADLAWTPQVVTRYGSTGGVEIAHRLCLWYRTFAAQPVRLVLVRAPRTKGFEIALISTDTSAAPVQIVERYASRWSIEVAFEEAKQVTGVGEARNRKELAVRRTVPFGFFCQSLLTLWYATSLHADSVVAERRRLAPWYRTKLSPSTFDMLVAARRVLIAERFSATRPGAPTPSEILEVQRAWAIAAA